MHLSLPARDHYHPNGRKLAQLFTSGAIASLAVLLAGYELALFGLPGVDYAALYGAILEGQRAPGVGSLAWGLGMAVHFLAGALVFPLAYDFLLDRRLLPNIPRLKGVLWGIFLWVFLQVILTPSSGRGFFSCRMSHPVLTLVETFLTWVLYGIIFESMTRVPIVHKLREWRHAA